jgi:hypothetical protein
MFQDNFHGGWMAFLARVYDVGNGAFILMCSSCFEEVLLIACSEDLHVKPWEDLGKVLFVKGFFLRAGFKTQILLG